uniref:Ovule protein n=1 Tax=Panagrellus redivivus TaxID=6233 RepID=A0A7E4VAP9_PANRE
MPSKPAIHLPSHPQPAHFLVMCVPSLPRNDLPPFFEFFFSFSSQCDFTSFTFFRQGCRAATAIQLQSRDDRHIPVFVVNALISFISLWSL